MRRALIVTALTAVGVGLLFHYQPGGGPGTATSVPPDEGAARDGTYTGTLESEVYGRVQVRIVVEEGRLVDISTVSLVGDSPHSQELNQHAAPILRSETLRAQSARIDAVTGATYTSDAYIESLGTALDRAER
ncbi:MAG TPA: FMN-binding protein [Candidatus Dormibacteraeota bacterium]|jgi:uncharacterized protein with FMN-binding domain|nr:FMN-binding protein [Candidatus Dormibacteraeota bacterium]